MRHAWGTGVVVFVAFLGGARAAEEAKDVKVAAVGQAAIVGGDTPQARDRAIDDALRRAVEQAVGTLVSAETVTQNFELLSDKIYAKSKGYVSKYEIVSEAKKEGVYEVNIKAEVKAGDLSKDLDGILAVLRAKKMPRVLVMIAEQNVGQANETFWWGDKNFSANLDAAENAFINAWKPKGVRFVDRQAITGKIKVGAALGSAAPADDAVKEFAGKAGAEVVIVGKAFARDVGPMMGTQMHSIRANLSLRALKVDTGEVLATSTTTHVAGHIDPGTGGTQALQGAAQKAAHELLERILEQWQGELGGSASVTVVINKVKGLKNVRALSATIEGIRGVTDVRQRAFGDSKVELEVDIKGSAQDLAVELEDKQFPGFRVEVEAVTANTVTGSVK